MRKLMAFLLVILLLIVASYSAAWYLIAGNIKSSLVSGEFAIDDRTVNLQSSKIEIGGYPLNIKINIHNPVIKFNEGVVTQLASDENLIVKAGLFGKDINIFLPKKAQINIVDDILHYESAENSKLKIGLKSSVIMSLLKGDEVLSSENFKEENLDIGFNGENLKIFGNHQDVNTEILNIDKLHLEFQNNKTDPNIIRSGIKVNIDKLQALKHEEDIILYKKIDFSSGDLCSLGKDKTINEMFLQDADKAWMLEALLSSNINGDFEIYFEKDIARNLPIRMEVKTAKYSSEFGEFEGIGIYHSDESKGIINTKTVFNYDSENWLTYKKKIIDMIKTCSMKIQNKDEKYQDFLKKYQDELDGIVLKILPDLDKFGRATLILDSVNDAEMFKINNYALFNDIFSISLQGEYPLGGQATADKINFVISEKINLKLKVENYPYIADSLLNYIADIYNMIIVIYDSEVGNEANNKIVKKIVVTQEMREDFNNLFVTIANHSEGKNLTIEVKAAEGQLFPTIGKIPMFESFVLMQKFVEKYFLTPSKVTKNNSVTDEVPLNKLNNNDNSNGNIQNNNPQQSLEKPAIE